MRPELSSSRQAQTAPGWTSTPPRTGRSPAAAGRAVAGVDVEAHLGLPLDVERALGLGVLPGAVPRGDDALVGGPQPSAPQMPSDGGTNGEVPVRMGWWRAAADGPVASAARRRGAH